ncbi:Rrf2 family transcriptional regulator [Sphingomonas sp.]|uniref:Rrf2 family transcriptional regulator n=1 Tax=Sphingomonas sp. TaxID=28214 RepID=UPI0035C819D2
MRIDSKLSRMLHVLLHMARHDGAFTSEQIACMLGTNAVVVRRTMAGLRQAGFVASSGGHGGGWSIARDLADVSLLDVYRAVGSPRLFALGNENASPACGVERVVNGSIDEALDAAQAILLARFADVSLQSLASEFDAICSADGWPHVPPPSACKASRPVP